MRNKVYKWVLGAKQQATGALRSLTALFVGTPVKNEGDPQGNMMGWPAGCVAWPVDPSMHDGGSFLAADAFIAEYEHATQTVHMLDRIAIPPNPLAHVPIGKPAVRHPGEIPLKVGTNVRLAPGVTSNTVGIVVRSAEYGTAGLAENVFFPVGERGLIAQHIFGVPGIPATGPDPSTRITEPGAQPAPISGYLNDVVITRRSPSINRQTYDETFLGSPGTPIPQPSPADQPTTVLMGQHAPYVISPNNPRAHALGGLANIFFGNVIGCMSRQVGGPLWFLWHTRFHIAETQNPQQPTGTDWWTVGGLDALASFSHGGIMEGPDDRAPMIEPPVAFGAGNPTRVRFMFDPDGAAAENVWKKHYGPLGAGVGGGYRMGVYRLHVPLPSAVSNPGTGPGIGGGGGDVGGVDKPRKPEGEKDSALKKRAYYWDANLEIGGIDGLPFPGIHKLAR